MYQKRKRIFLFFLAMLTLFTFVSCSDEQNQEQLQYGSLSIETANPSADTFAPTDAEVDITHYTVTGINPNGESETLKTTTDKTMPITIDSLLVGSWSITINGLNAAGTIVQTATQAVTIEATKNTTSTFNLHPANGTGSCDITITWSENISAVDSIVISTDSALTESEPAIPTTGVSLTVSDATESEGMKTCTKSISNIPAGSYQVTLQLLDKDGNQIGNKLINKMNIYDGMTSTGTFSMMYTVTITPPTDWTENSVVIANAYATLSATVTPTPADDKPMTYTWYVDGVKQASTTSELVIGDMSSDNPFIVTPIGLHQILATVTDGGDKNYSGSYLFDSSLSGTIGNVKFVADDGAVNDFFGDPVAIDGDTALVGAEGTDNSKGSAYIFTRDTDGTWSQTQELTASDGMGNDYFGRSVALDGDTALVGERTDNWKGSAYIFTRDTDGTWSQTQKLTASDGESGDYFGSSVALDDDIALLGAYGTNSATGSAYIFTKEGNSWSQTQKLSASDGAPSDQFVCSVALDDDIALIGAERTDSETGSAYIFTNYGNSWSQTQKLTASDRESGDHFGYSVALSGNTALIGAEGRTNSEKGSAYIYGIE